MEKKCLGCGAVLQDNNPEDIGYVQDLSKDYCKRCYQMIHYDIHKENDFVADNETILNDLEKFEGDYIWIMDIFDLDTSLNSPLADFYKSHHCDIILNKCDLLPNTVNYLHLSDYVLGRIKEMGIDSGAVITRGINDDFIENFDKYLYKGKPVVFTGVFNVGKSTIINQLLGKDIVTTNRYPATTICINEIQSEKYHFFDSAGLWIDSSCLANIKPKDLKIAFPYKQVRPTVYQLEDNQSLAIGGLVRLDCYNAKKLTVVVYASNLLEIHRGKKESADGFWEKHFGNLLKPVGKDSKHFSDYKKVAFIHQRKADYFISGLGFVTIVGNRCNVDFYLPKEIYVSKREAMI